VAKKQGTAGGKTKDVVGTFGGEGRKSLTVAHDRVHGRSTKEDDVANAIGMIPQPSASVITVEVKIRLQALAIPEAVGGYSVIVPSLPGCVTQGETIEEVTANVVEAAEGWLAAGHDHNKDEDLRLARGE